jgi:hypothetical protein
MAESRTDVDPGAPCARPCLHPRCSALRQAASKIEPTPNVSVGPAAQGDAPAPKSAVTNSERQAEWRSRQDGVALRLAAKNRMRTLRATRKARP